MFSPVAVRFVISFPCVDIVTLRVGEKSSKYAAILWLLSGQLDYEVLGWGIWTGIAASDECSIGRRPAVAR